jgi:hypothetical protein
MDKKLFLISNNLDVKEIDSQQYNLETFENTILDGEYVYLADKNKFLYLAFDCLMFKGTDMRDEPKLETRLEKLNEVLKDAFKVQTINNKYDKQGNLDDMIEFYKTQVISVFTEMNNKLQKENTVFMGKLFFIPLGIYNDFIVLIFNDFKSFKLYAPIFNLAIVP